MSTRETALVRIPVTDLDDTFLGTRLLVVGEGPLGPVCAVGGVSDLYQSPGGQFAGLWIGGQYVDVDKRTTVVAEAPPEA